MPHVRGNGQRAVPFQTNTGRQVVLPSGQFDVYLTPSELVDVANSGLFDMLSSSKVVANLEVMHEDDPSLAEQINQVASTSTDTSAYMNTNGESYYLNVGLPVSTVNGQLKRGDAGSEALSFIQGIVTVGGSPTNNTTVQSDGVVNLTTTQWDAVTGQVGGLTPSARYYLGVQPGPELTTTPTLSLGTHLVAIGRAASPTEMVLRIQPPILI